MPLIWRARTDSGSLAIARKTAQLMSVARIAAPSTPSFASSSARPSKAIVEISSETVNPMPATAPPPASTGQLTGGRSPPSREPSHDPATMPIGLPST